MEDWNKILDEALDGLSDKKFAKMTDNTLNRLDNLWKSNKEKGVYDKFIQSNRGKGKSKPKGFGEKIAALNRNKKYSEETKKKLSDKAKARRKPIEKTLENPKVTIILDLLKKGATFSEIQRQSKCSCALYYKIKNYYNNLNN